MCLILDVPDQADPLSMAEFDDVAKKNSDGICVLSRAGELIYRGLDLYRAAEVVIGRTGILVHWRHATHGLVDEDRCHGWQIGGARLLHNGILPGAWGDRVRSDTSHLVETLIDVGADLSDPAWDPLIRGIAGRSVVVITGRGTEPTWLAQPHTSWRGRLYSNSYAWTGSIHGVPPPPPPPPPDLQGVRQYRLPGGWAWADDGALILPRKRRKS